MILLKNPEKGQTTRVFGAKTQVEGQNWDFFGGIDTSEKPSPWQRKGFVRVILDSLLLFELMKRLGGSAVGAEGSGLPGVYRESKT
jgi:hypothetical protein